MYLYHIQSLYNDSVPTIPCLNMFISCMNYNYGKIHKKKSLFKYELNNTHLSTLPYVYCCDIQLIKYFEFLKLKETCYKIIKNNKIYDNFLSHLSSYIFDDSYFIIPFFTSYGKFLIIIKTNKNIDNLQQSMDTLKNKNSITYDVIINSFVFPNDSSFQAIIHFSHIFINTLKNLFKTRNSDEDIPDITFENLLNVDKKRLIYHNLSCNKQDILHDNFSRTPNKSNIMNYQNYGNYTREANYNYNNNNNTTNLSNDILVYSEIDDVEETSPFPIVSNVNLGEQIFSTTVDF
ncbi:hypothetical protein PFFCH_02240 [Plasmodium falciparum FCH/4]|uniref:Uncharacterized protein n=1 Tax=Plasmodium falciparum FCH/4 TaxID=1036724 RepID=A0A024VPD2_PLAFA|nr:hypothetical protein PFFCH_02240 [Plasmodium falciparum FCH/4]